jgi:hypothetical protein
MTEPTTPPEAAALGACVQFCDDCVGKCLEVVK